MKKERPIIFSTDMVQAIKDGRKIETRRPVNSILRFGQITEFDKSNTKGYDWHFRNKRMLWNDIRHEKLMYGCPYGIPGDLLYVRETWQHTQCLNLHSSDENYGYVYKADGQPWQDYEGWQWKPSIHMPKKASRIWLEIQDRWVERLQDISEEGAINEGWRMQPERSDNPEVHKDAAKDWFSDLWELIHGPGSWEQNPWVWVISFKVVSINGKPV